MSLPTSGLDRFLPRFDVFERHTIEVSASPERVYRAVTELDFEQSLVVRALFRLRGMPRAALTLSGLETLGFIRLDATPPWEMAVGLVGKFWTPSGHLQNLDASGFIEFDRPGFAKAVWGIAVEPRVDGPAVVTTETRVLGLDTKSRRLFRLYWLVVGPFSAWTRREALRLVKATAEN